MAFLTESLYSTLVLIYMYFTFTWHHSTLDVPEIKPGISLSQECFITEIKVLISFIVFTSFLLAHYCKPFKLCYHYKIMSSSSRGDLLQAKDYVIWVYQEHAEIQATYSLFLGATAPGGIRNFHNSFVQMVGGWIIQTIWKGTYSLK